MNDVNTILSVNNLSVVLKGKEILKNAGFGVEKNKLTVILGLNGAGKTTLFRTILGVINQSNGEIYLGNENIKHINQKERAKRISYVVQNTSSNLDLSVFDFVLMGSTPYLGVFSVPNHSHYKSVEDALKQLSIDHLKHKSMQNISGGERQLVYLARALVQKCDLMLMDEPTSYLDFKTQHTFLQNLKKFIIQEHKTALITLHDPTLAVKYADSIIFIHNNSAYRQLNKADCCFINKLSEVMNEIYGENIRVKLVDDEIYFDWISDEK